MNRPNTETVALMDAARHAHGDCTDYRLARLLGVQTSNTTAWRRRGVHMSDDYAAKCAELAGLDPVESVLRVAAERETGTTQRILRTALARITGAAASVLLVALALVFGARGPALAGIRALSSTEPPALTCIYYAKLLVRLAARLIARLELPLVCLA